MAILSNRAILWLINKEVEKYENSNKVTEESAHWHKLSSNSSATLISTDSKETISNVNKIKLDLRAKRQPLYR